MNTSKNRIMKNVFSVKIAGAIVLFTLLAFSFREANYYVVIGAFASETNARKFTGYARNVYLEAYYKLNPDRNLYYVYVMQTARKDDARNWTWYLKNETGFRDAWVFTEVPQSDNALTFFDQSGNRHTSPRYSGGDHAVAAEGRTVAMASADNTASYKYIEPAGGATIDAAWTTTDEISYTANLFGTFNAGRKVSLAQGEVFTFIAETPDGKMLPAEIMLVDYKKARKVTGFHTGEYIGLRGRNRNQSLTFVCDVFGYSVDTKVIYLDKPARARDVRRHASGVWEVRFKLKPMKVNEISILYNTVFYPDAAVLEPSSRKQVDELLALMKANPSYKILIHSHCNAAARRDIKLPADNAYFDIGSALPKTGTDKQLTKQRAETIRSDLVDHGIDNRRIQVFGWGSLDNLVSASGADTAINERVEVELLSN